jgi:hypothetical protein
MAIIYSYPVTEASMSDVMVVSDVSANGKPTKSISVSGIKTVIDVVDKITDINGQNGQTGDIKLSGSNTIDIDFNAGANSITFDTIAVPTINGPESNFLPLWSNTSGVLSSSLVKQDINAPSVIITQNAYLQVDALYSNKIHDSNGEFGSANQLLSASASGGQVEWITPTPGDTYTIQAGSKIDDSVPLNLDASTGTDSSVKLTGGTGITLTATSSAEITITSTSSLIAGSGVQIGSGTIQTDNLANGGIIYSGASNELAVDVGASSITGVLDVNKGGSGNASLARYSVFMQDDSQTSSAFKSSTDSTNGIIIPGGTLSQRPAADSETLGMIRYNSSSKNFQGVILGEDTHTWVDITPAVEP